MMSVQRPPRSSRSRGSIGATIGVALGIIVMDINEETKFAAGQEWAEVFRAGADRL